MVLEQFESGGTQTFAISIARSKGKAAAVEPQKITQLEGTVVEMLRGGTVIGPQPPSHGSHKGEGFDVRPTVPTAIGRVLDRIRSEAKGF